MKNFTIISLTFLFLTSSINLFSQDTEPPTAIAFNGTATIIIPLTGYVSLPASYFNHNSFDNVTSNDHLRFSFSSDINDSIKVFCKTETVDITLYVWDEAGNFSFALTSITTIFDGESEGCCACYYDNLPPIAICLSDINLEINEDGFTSSIFPKDISINSYDNESGISYQYFINSIETSINYGCQDLGENILESVVSDMVGLKDTCSTIVNVTDPNDYCSALAKKVIENGKLNIQPNPANNETSILNADQFLFLQIIDAAGQVINKIEQPQKNLFINTSHLPVGIYFVQGIKENKLTISTKLVVSH